MGEGGGRNSTLDLTWCNMAALVQGTFFGAEVDFGGSQGSDHALIRTIASTPVPVFRAPADRTDRFDTDIEVEAWEEWERILCFELPPLIQPRTPAEVDALVDDIYLAFVTDA
jgi:hypothetical protein